MKASEWAFERIKEAFDLAAKEEVEKMSIVQEIVLRSTDYLRRIIAPVGGQGGVTMSYLCTHCNSLPIGRLRLVGFWGEETYQVMVRTLPRSSTIFCKRPSPSFCWFANSFNALTKFARGTACALKTLACSILSPVCTTKVASNRTFLHKLRRKGLKDGLREYERALDVGSLRRGTGTFEVRKPKAPEGGSDMN